MGFKEKICNRLGGITFVIAVVSLIFAFSAYNISVNTIRANTYDPRFVPENFRIENYRGKYEIADALSPIIKSNTSRKEIERVLIEGAGMWSEADKRKPRTVRYIKHPFLAYDTYVIEVNYDPDWKIMNLSVGGVPVKIIK